MTKLRYSHKKQIKKINKKVQILINPKLKVGIKTISVKTITKKRPMTTQVNISYT
jgi:hypothetical protein